MELGTNINNTFSGTTTTTTTTNKEEETAVVDLENGVRFSCYCCCCCCGRHWPQFRLRRCRISESKRAEVSVGGNPVDIFRLFRLPAEPAAADRSPLGAVIRAAPWTPRCDKKKRNGFSSKIPPKKTETKLGAISQQLRNSKVFCLLVFFFGSRNGNSHGRVRCVGRGRATLIGCPSRPPEELFLRIYFVFFCLFSGVWCFS